MMKSAATVERKDGSRMKCEHLTLKAAHVSVFSLLSIPLLLSPFLLLVPPKLLRVSLFVVFKRPPV